MPYGDETRIHTTHYYRRTSRGGKERIAAIYTK